MVFPPLEISQQPLAKMNAIPEKALLACESCRRYEAV
jgi:hypothetical protein